MLTNRRRPWLATYPPTLASDIAIEYSTALAMFDASVQRAPDCPAIKYFDRVLTLRDLDEQSANLAAALHHHGAKQGERIALYLQNVPQFVIAMLATWKLGAVAVSVNPMSRARELAHLLNDSGARVLICLESLYGEIARDVIGETDVAFTVTTSELEYQTRHDQRLFAGSTRVRHAGTLDMSELIAHHRGETVPEVDLRDDDVAVLTYTSGTTGPPKGAMNTHRNVVFTTQVYRDWACLDADDSILGVAPLYHVTGLIGHLALSLLLPAPLVLAYRFEPVSMLATIREHRPTFTVGAITVFIALMNAEESRREDFSSFSTVCSGGAPVSRAIVDRFEADAGIRIRAIYGLTETTSPSHFPPPGTRPPIDPSSGTCSVGVPVANTTAWVIGENGEGLGAGEFGEIVIAGPQVVPGYWGKPEETRHALPNGELHTGDIGFMDEQGWFYVVDRKKDMINASGYKVWPREVEDLLYEHPAVREVAVVGVPDPYRGETVKAFVSLKPGSTATPGELQEFAKNRIAAYKYPRQIELIDELPKTLSGKILRRSLKTTST